LATTSEPANRFLTKAISNELAAPVYTGAVFFCLDKAESCNRFYDSVILGLARFI
jgi:hypothetical protein